MTKKDTTEPTELQQAMAAVEAGESPFAADAGDTDFLVHAKGMDEGLAAPFPFASRIKSDPTAVPLDEPIEPSVRPHLFGSEKAGIAIGADTDGNSALKVKDAFAGVLGSDVQISRLPRVEEQGEMFSDDTAKLVNERGKTHGDYGDTARISQAFKKLVLLELDAREYRGQSPLTDAQHESVDMICLKLARIISGDSALADHWDDIGGYARIAN